MPQFQPSSLNDLGDYGATGSPARQNFLMSWWADDTMVALARAGSGAGPEIYEELEPRMTKPPKDLMEAYEQASYFVAIAALRARRLEEEGNPAAGHTFLLAQLNALVQEVERAKDDVGMICSWTGYWCPVRGSGAVLDDAIEVIEDSQLPDEERVRMTTILRKSKRAVQFRQAVPWLVLVGVGAIAGTYWYQKNRT